MKPIRLKLCAFGPYAAEQVVDFRELRGRNFFLIHGPTGGGKTSLLDAICYALYGDTSDLDRTAEQMRSHLADPATATSVCFDFALGQKCYRVSRSPEQQRPKRRGGGTMSDAPKACISDRTACAEDSDDGVPLASQPTKVTKCVEDLLGFRSEQFRQVMVLPQGKFRELLVAGSQQREEILRVLFGTEIYGRMQDALKAKARSVQLRADQLRIEHDTMLKSAGSETVSDLQARRDQADSNLDALKTIIEQCRAAKSEAAIKLLEAQQVHVKLIEREQSRQALERLEIARLSVSLDRSRSAAAQRAACLAPIEGIVRDRRRDADSRAKEMTTATAALDACTRRHGLAFKQLNLQVSRQSETDACRQEITRLDGYRERVQTIDQVARDLRDADARATTLKSKLDEAGAELKTQQEFLGVAQARLDAARQLAAADEGNQLAVSQDEQRLRVRREIEVVSSERASAESRGKSLQAQVEQAAQRALAAKVELDRLQKLNLAGQSAVLAAKLVAGDPCPVCGSVHHPIPAVAADELPSAQQIEDQKEKVATSDREALQLRQTLGEALTQAARMAEKEASFLELLSDSASQSVLELQRALKQRRAAAAASRSALGQVPAIENELRSAQDTSKALLVRIAQIELDSKGASETLSGLRAIRDGAIEGVPEEFRTQAALSGAKVKAEARLKAIDDALGAARAAASDAERNLAAAAERARSAAAETESATAAFAAGMAEFAKQRAAEGFASDAELAAARLPETQVRQLQERIVAFDESIVAAIARVERAEITAHNLLAPDLPALQAAATGADERLEESLKQQTQHESERERIDQALISLHRSARLLDELDAEYAIIGQVSEVASGKNQAGLTFQRFVLTFLLDDVLVAATHRLRLMSRGRYQLHRRRDRADGRASAGLDLEVFDTYTGTARPVATLSGGESFLASLSLALGLADVVQARSGGIRLETLFIDEGFGSLDPEALDLALRALTDLMKDGRLVGIISHVPELREQVPARLEIINDRSGSAARFVLG